MAGAPAAAVAAVAAASAPGESLEQCIKRLQGEMGLWGRVSSNFWGTGANKQYHDYKRMCQTEAAVKKARTEADMAKTWLESGMIPSELFPNGMLGKRGRAGQGGKGVRGRAVAKRKSTSSATRIKMLRSMTRKK
jgi:hypothetical protein